LAAEKSKTAFYIAGAVLVVWALVLSMAIGMRRPSFPDSLRVERGVIAISVVPRAGHRGRPQATSPGDPGDDPGGHPKAPASTVKAPIAPARPHRLPPTDSAPAPASKPPAEHQATTKEAKKKAAKAPAAPTKKPAPAPAVTKLALSVPGTALAYNTKQLSAKAGSVTITLTNSSPLEHDVTVSEGSKVVGATPVFTGGTKSVTLKLKAGTQPGSKHRGRARHGRYADRPT
jgi:plastocyanin